LEVFFMYLF